MKIFGRKPTRYLLAFKNLPNFLVATWRALFIFKNPHKVIVAYLIRQPIKGGRVLLRSGHVIELSDDVADIVTIFLIFARQDYGRIVSGSTVVDIGANIGVFALYAAIGGAKAVLAYEPSTSSYEILSKNISVNRFDNIIFAKKLAVVGQESEPVKFPRASNVMNSILHEVQEGQDYDIIPTIKISTIIEEAQTVDLLKLDCEGGEYDIFSHAEQSELSRVSEIRMEYHLGPSEQMINRLIGMGFKVVQYTFEGSGAGYLWMKLES